MSELVMMEKHDAIALLKLNRPEKLNALNYAMIDHLLQCLSDIEQDESLRAIILTGEGNKAFSAGGDIYEFSNSIKHGVDEAVREFVMRGQTMTSRLETFPKPIIVAVNGLAFGGGCEITEAAHLAIASDKSSFAKPEINIGIPPTFGGTQRLPRLAGRKRALGYLLTGDAFTPETAFNLGLVNAVVPHKELLSSAFAMANRILQHSPLAISRIISAVTRGVNVSISEGLEIEKEQFARIASSKDVLVGLDAWIARRPPSYLGE